MGRNKTYDETEVFEALATLFARNGYEATSIDQIATATGMKRGSIYQAFDSKANLFRLALEHALGTTTDNDQLADLVFVGMWERAGIDPAVRTLAQQAITRLEDATGDSLGSIISGRLYTRAGLNQD